MRGAVLSVCLLVVLCGCGQSEHERATDEIRAALRAEEWAEAGVACNKERLRPTPLNAQI